MSDSISIRKPKDLQDKSAWVKYGGALEKPFVEQAEIEGWRLAINPGKEANPYTHDLVALIPSDLKTMDTQWKHSQKMFGIPPEYAVSINTKDFVRYERLYPNIIIILDVRWSGDRYTLTLDRVNKLINLGRAKKHYYKNRVDDENGNAQSSYVFDLRHLDKIHDAPQLQNY